jgi:hypothetical protein
MLERDLIVERSELDTSWTVRSAAKAWPAHRRKQPRGLTVALQAQSVNLRQRAL